MKSKCEQTPRTVVVPSLTYRQIKDEEYNSAMSFIRLFNQNQTSLDVLTDIELIFIRIHLPNHWIQATVVNHNNVLVGGTNKRLCG